MVWQGGILCFSLAYEMGWQIFVFVLIVFWSGLGASCARFHTLDQRKLSNNRTKVSLLISEAEHLAIERKRIPVKCSLWNTGCQFPMTQCFSQVSLPIVCLQEIGLIFKRMIEGYKQRAQHLGDQIIGLVIQEYVLIISCRYLKCSVLWE